MQRRTVNWWRQLSSRKGVMMDFAIISYTKGVFHAHSFRLRGLFRKHLSMLKTFSQRFSPIQALSHLNKSVRSPILIGNGDLDLVWLPMPGVWDAAECGDHGPRHIPSSCSLLATLWQMLLAGYPITILLFPLPTSHCRSANSNTKCSRG